MKFFHSSLPHTDGLLAPTDTLPATETDEQQKKCASLLAEKEELSKSSLKDKTNLQQLEKELASSLAQNAELSNSLIALERPQQELEKRLAALQLQHQQDSTKWQTQLDEADSCNMALQRERAWMTWGLAVAVTVMAVTAAALFRTPAPFSLPNQEREPAQPPKPSGGRIPSRIPSLAVCWRALWQAPLTQSSNLVCTKTEKIAYILLLLIRRAPTSHCLINETLYFRWQRR